MDLTESDLEKYMKFFAPDSIIEYVKETHQ